MSQETAAILVPLEELVRVELEKCVPSADVRREIWGLCVVDCCNRLLPVLKKKSSKSLLVAISIDALSIEVAESHCGSQAGWQAGEHASCERAGNSIAV